ncbi:hypothetical protein T03_17517 [Trichinella britovi]|uniref:Uncharacterized protein n=1 Tax=Trichinella britovi TaxID=45882 RepID=A0A0V1CCA6_TRIBR|nr:hypothetical protein T03_17517 [Trichinella britovi]
MYEILEPGWSPRLSPLPLSPLGSFSLTSAVVRLQPIEVYHQPFPSTSHLLHLVHVPIQLPLDLVRTVPVRPKFGVASTPDQQARRRVCRLSCLSKPFGVVVPGRLSFGPPRTPAPNLRAGATQTPVQTCLAYPSATRVSRPLVAGALCRTQRGWEWLRLCSKHWSGMTSVRARGRHPSLPDGRWTPSLACPAVCGSSALPSRLTAGGKR